MRQAFREPRAIHSSHPWLTSGEKGMGINSCREGELVWRSPPLESNIGSRSEPRQLDRSKKNREAFLAVLNSNGFEPVLVVGKREPWGEGIA
jgi:hypothetical protein